MMNVVLIGAGQRGRVYADYLAKEKNIRIAAVAEPDRARRQRAAAELGIAEDRCFATAQELWEQGKIADVAIITSMDRNHYAQTMAALELGYHILLEKPISPDPWECMMIQRRAHECGRKIVVCHVLRYTNFFMAIRKILDSGELGRVVTIQHAENVGNFHMAHSFVRGNWRNSDETSPIIMQKSCHDMDILVWLAGSEAKKIASFGSLSYFHKGNAPRGSAERCLECPAAPECRFDARKAYLPMAGQWPATVLGEDQTEAGLLNALKTGPYGRCVFRCDNNVCDHQVTVIEFKNGVTASFHLSGLTNKMHRTIKVMCEHGEIEGDDGENILRVSYYASNPHYTARQELLHISSEEGGHGGGDYGLMREFLSALQDPHKGSRSSIDQSVESHIMAYAAERARVTGQVVEMDPLKQQLLQAADR